MDNSTGGWHIRSITIVKYKMALKKRNRLKIVATKNISRFPGHPQKLKACHPLKARGPQRLELKKSETILSEKISAF